MGFIKYTQGPATVVHHNMVCICDSDEHQMNFRYFLDEADTLYCTFHLNPEQNLFKRIWMAVKYVFGYRSKYGDFAEVLLNKEKVQELKKVIESFEKISQE